MKTRFPSACIALAAAPMPKSRIALVAEPIPSGRIAPAAMLLVAALLIAALLLAGCTFGELPGIKQQPSCGNLECEGGETAENCPQDCADCTDNDNGINFFVTGFAQDNVGGFASDVCTPSTGIITEGFCSKNQAYGVNFQCPNGCSIAGACFCEGVSVAFRTSAVNGNYADGGWIALDRDGDGALEGYGFQVLASLIYNPAENPVLAKTPEGYYVISHSPIGAPSQTVSILYTTKAPVGGETYSAAIHSNLDADAAGADLQTVPVYFYAYSDMEVCFDGTEYFSCADIPCAQQQYCVYVDPVNPEDPSKNAVFGVGERACNPEDGNEELRECALVGGEPQLQMVEDCAAAGGRCVGGVCVLNEKDLSKYFPKEAFLISDNNWQSVLELVPVAIWDGEGGQHKYPMLIYHQEGSAFDADSIIHFLQQYNPGRVTLVGSYPEQLYGLLCAAPPLGVGLSPSSLQTISSNDTISYWGNLNTVVYVDDDYGNALLASTYASLKNAPLVIQGSQFDTETVMGGKNALCLGPSGWSQPAYVQCTEFYTAEQLQEHYVALTNTDKVLFVNPNDINLEFSISDSITPEKSQTPIGELYTKNSLSAPYLAAARYEVLVSNLAYAPEPDYSVVADDLHSAINRLLPDLLTRPGGITSVGGEYINGYLTIMATHRAVPAKGVHCPIQTPDNISPLDNMLYADITGDNCRPNMSVGRIAGLTASDVSAYVARGIFYNNLAKTNSVVFMASTFTSMIDHATRWSPAFQKAGYQTNLYTNTTDYAPFDPALWENRDLVSYLDHGNSCWSGIDSDEIPELSNSIVSNFSCLTCTSQGTEACSFCMNSLRKGALAYFGAVGLDSVNNKTYMNIKNGIYYDGLAVGEAFAKYVDVEGGYYYYPTTLIGDPALDVQPTYRLSQPLEWEGE